MNSIIFHIKKVNFERNIMSIGSFIYLSDNIKKQRC